MATAVIVAAGRGVRAGGDVPKQYQLLGTETVLARTVSVFRDHPRIAHIVIVVPESDLPYMAERMGASVDGLTLVPGGTTRAASVGCGLAAAPDGSEKVLIHDAARPLVAPETISRVLDALDFAPGAAPALAMADAIWLGGQGRVASIGDKRGMFRAQTPQGFHLEAIRAAHAALEGDAADDVEVALAAGLDVRIVEGDERNFKITRPGDLARAAREMETTLDIRTGQGFDVHRFGPGDKVVLCGVEIPHSHGLVGHSDADVGMHALTDAIYGGLAEGDIGRHFPPSDPKWKGAASEIFLAHAAELAGKKGYTISNCDCTLICEHPKIGPHALEMASVLARIMGLKPDRVSVKATTSEGLGFTGRQEGIAAMATVTLVRA